MSLVVVGIVLLHAIPVLLIGILANSKALLILAAIISGVIGIAVGNPTYTFADLFGVCLAYIVGSSIIESKRPTASSKLVQLAQPAAAPPAADELHFLHVIALCVVGGWMRAVDAVHKFEDRGQSSTFLDRLFDPWFLGFVAAPTGFFVLAACAGWLIGKSINSMRAHATSLALAFAIGLFFLLKLGGDFADKQHLVKDDEIARQSVPLPRTIEKSQPITQDSIASAPKVEPQPYSSETAVRPQRHVVAPSKSEYEVLQSQLSVAERLNALEIQLNNGPKAMGDHMTLIRASLNGSSLSILLRLNNYTVMDAGAQAGIASFGQDITKYYCSSEPYRELIDRGAVLMIQLFGKDSGSIGAYPVTIESCRR